MNNLFRKFIRTLSYFAGFVVAVFIILYWATSGEYPVPKTVEQDPSIPHISIGNAVFHAETFGNDTNEVVIVIHGGPGNDYRHLLSLKDLSDKYFVVFYDQRGTGLSPRVSADELSLDTMLTDLKSIADYYSKDSEVILIGHSWGGMLASGYIAQHPTKVKKAVLAEPGMLTTKKAEEFSGKFQLELNPQVFWFLVKTWFQSLHIQESDKQARGDYFFGQLVLADMDGNPMAGYFCNTDPSTGSLEFWRYSWTSSHTIMEKARDNEGKIHLDLVSGLENYTQKVLFLAGDCNIIIGPDYQKSHMEYFPKAEMVVIRDAGHTMIGEKPEECLKVIREYLSE